MSGYGFEAAIHEAGRRRMRTLAAGGGAVAIAIALVGLVPRAGGTSGLEPADTPRTPQATATSWPASTPDPVPPRDVTRQAAAAAPENGAAPQPTTTSSARRRTASPTSPRSDIVRYGPFSQLEVASECLAGGTQEGPWCFHAFSSKPGVSVSLDLYVCFAAVSGGTLEFPFGDEVTMAVTTEDGDVVWQPRGEPSAAHSVELQAGACVVWRTKWHRTDLDGRPVSAGSYVFRATLRATNAPHGDSVDFTV